MPPDLPAGRPFDDIRSLVAALPAPDAAALPAGGRQVGIAGLLAWLAAWQGRPQPAVNRPQIVVFAATHAVAPAEDAEAVAALVARLGSGDAALNRLCGAFNLGLKVLDLALDSPAADIAREAALDERAAVATMAYGMEAAAGGIDLLALADPGIGNAVPVAALLAALGHAEPDAVPEPARTALALHGPAAAGDPLEALRRLGGRDVAAIAGAILAARLQRIPVLLDGPATLAAAAVLHALRPDALDHCRLAATPGDSRPASAAAGRLGLQPLLGLPAEPGIAAALAVEMVRGVAMAAG